MVPEVRPKRALALFARFVTPRSTPWSDFGPEGPNVAIGLTHNDGMVEARAEGGAGPPYVYEWHHNATVLPQVEQKIVATDPFGVYSAVVADVLGNTATSEVLYLQPASSTDSSSGVTLSYLEVFIMLLASLAVGALGSAAFACGYCRDLLALGNDKDQHEAMGEVSHNAL